MAQDQRHIDREAEQAKQDKVAEAVASIDWTEEGRRARAEQAALVTAARGGPAVIQDKPDPLAKARAAKAAKKAAR